MLRIVARIAADQLELHLATRELDRELANERACSSATTSWWPR